MDNCFDIEKRVAALLPLLCEVGDAVLKRWFDIQLETSWWHRGLGGILTCADASHAFKSSSIIVGKTCDDSLWGPRQTVGYPIYVNGRYESWDELDLMTKFSRLCYLVCRNHEWVLMKSRLKMTHDSGGNWVYRFKSESLDDACAQLGTCKETLILHQSLCDGGAALSSELLEMLR